jgi:hypothetical protein
VSAKKVTVNDDGGFEDKAAVAEADRRMRVILGFASFGNYLVLANPRPSTARALQVIVA